MDRNSDEQLVRIYLQGEINALSILVERYLSYIYNFIVKQIGDRKEAEDLVQEVFLRAWKNLKKFDLDKNFKIWIFSIARNACIDYLRRKKIPVFSALEKDDSQTSFEETIIDESESVAEKINQQELAGEMNKYLKQISEANRTVLVLHYNQQLTFQEIADLLGEPLDTVKSRHRRGLLYLKRLIVQAENSGAPKNQL